jgi:tetratricopeptide (TPR) repeat protein
MLISAAPAEIAEKWLREGNSAFERGDYATAIEWYSLAEEPSADPGLVAFNKGAALYRLGRFREAELHYLRCREDATGERLARLFYDLANAVTQQASDHDAKRLQEAIGYYEECLHQDAASAELKEDARFNLELAKALLVRAKTSRDQPSSEDNDGGEGNPNLKDQAKERNRGRGNVQRGTPDPRSDVRGARDRSNRGAENHQTTSEPPLPGVGNLPVLPDQDELAPLTPEDRSAYLEEVAAKILRERREHKQRSTGSASRALMDW